MSMAIAVTLWIAAFFAYQGELYNTAFVLVMAGIFVAIWTIAQED